MTELRTETGFADVDGTRLYYEVAGEGHPLLLVHAGIADSRMWADQFHIFAQHYKVIRYDMPGFGKSEVPAKPFSLHEEVAVLLHFLHVEKAYLVGISLGGRVALDFTLAYPDMVDALILVAPDVSGDKPSEEVQRFNAEEEAALERDDLVEATEINLRMWVDGPKRTPDQVNPAVREHVREMQLHAFTLPIPEGAEELPRASPAIARLAEIRVPTLIIVGNHDIQPKLTLATHLTTEIPGAKQVVIPGVAHMVNMERPEVFNRIVLNFLSGQ